MRKNLMKSVCMFWILISGGMLFGQTHHSPNPESLSLRSVGFIKNKGQLTDGKGNLRNDISYYGQSGSLEFYIHLKGISYQTIVYDDSSKRDISKADHLLPENESGPYVIYRTDIEWIGASKRIHFQSKKPSDERLHFYNTNSTAVTNVRSYEEVYRENLYPGIDLKYYFNGQNLEYDFLLAAGADPGIIQWEILGAKEIKINKNGDLLILTPYSEIHERAPIAYQNGKEIEVQWELRGNRIGFSIVDFDPNKPLIIDPLVQHWGTYYGGNRAEYAYSTSTDANGNIYMTGSTSSFSNIASSGAHSQTFSGDRDAFLVKMNKHGQRLWATYYGGSELDVATSCATDALLNVAISGYTSSLNGISTNGSHQVNFAGGSQDAFIAKFNSQGFRIWGTYYGGPNDDIGLSCAIGLGSNVYISGNTNSSIGISTPGTHQMDYVGGEDAYLAQFSSSGDLNWSTYYGGKGDETGLSICNSRSYVYLAGKTSSDSAMSTTGTYQEVYGGGFTDAFLVKFNLFGIREWGTYFGGPAYEEAFSCALDQGNRIYIAGESSSVHSLSTQNAHQANHGGNYDAFLARLDADGSLLWSTYYGGARNDYGRSCAVSPTAHVYLFGYTSSDTLISTIPIHQENRASKTDAFLSKFDSTGVRLWGTYFGGPSYEYGNCCTTDSYGAAICTGYTWSNSNISLAGAHQYNINTGPDAFLTKFVECSSSSSTISASACYEYLSPSGKHLWTNTGTYLDTLTNSAGCDSLISVQLTINTGPIKNIQAIACNFYISPSGNEIWTSSGVYEDLIPNPLGCDSLVIVNLTINQGPLDSLDITACNSFSLGGTNKTWTESGTYFAYKPNGPNCDSIIKVNLTIVKLDLNLVKDGITLTAMASPATYQWLDCNANFIEISGANGQSLTSTTAGAFAVIIDQGFCKDTSICYVITEADLGITEANQSILIYPNPSFGQINIQVNFDMANALYSLYDVQGKAVIQEKSLHLDAGIGTIKHQLAAGTYLLILKSEGMVLLRKNVIFTSPD